MKKFLSKYRLWIFAVLFAALGAGAAYASYASTSPVYSIIVVAGQSNADGAESYVSDPAAHFDLFTTTAHPADESTKLVWTNLVNNVGPPPVALKSIGTPAGKYTSSQATFGPEVGLARGLYDQGRRNVIILKVSYGGLSLGAKPGVQDWNIHSTNEAYASLVARMKTLQSWVKSQGGTATVDGFYWVQGEGDMTPELAPQYETNLRELVTKARSDMGMTSTAPFVIAKTSLAGWIKVAPGLFGSCGATSCEQLTIADQTVRNAQQKVADTMPNTKIVDTLNLPRHGVQIHLTNGGELQLGSMFAQASVMNTALVPPTSSRNPATTPAPAVVGAKNSSVSTQTHTTPTTSAATKSSPLSSNSSATDTSVQNSSKHSYQVKQTEQKSTSVWQRVRDYVNDRIQRILSFLSN